MINWTPFDPKNPPDKNKTFLVTNGKQVFVAYMDSTEKDRLQWWEEKDDDSLSGVTHYADINLPAEHLSFRNKYEIRGDVTAIFIESDTFGNHEVLIDTKRLNDIKTNFSHLNLYRDWNTHYVWCYTPGSKTKIMLHRFLMNAPLDMVVDHINRNGLDNRASNLRVVTRAENNQNRRGAQRNSKSQIRGVYWHKASGKWAAQIKFNSKTTHLGTYVNKEDAISAVKEARKRLMPFSEMDIS